MPRVTPHYGLFPSFQSILFFFILFLLAVKCNDDTNIIKLLAYLGTGFDCASKVNHIDENNSLKLLIFRAKSKKLWI
jgi:hypothetical protein